MKRVIIDPETRIVLNVEVVDENTPTTLRVSDSEFVGPGMVWNGNRSSPVFSEAAPGDEEAAAE